MKLENTPLAPSRAVLSCDARLTDLGRWPSQNELQSLSRAVSVKKGSPSLAQVALVGSVRDLLLPIHFKVVKPHTLLRLELLPTG